MSSRTKPRSTLWLSEYGLEVRREHWREYKRRHSVKYHLQELIAEHPELIDGEQIRPDDARRWILIAREKGIAETSDTGRADI